MKKIIFTLSFLSVLSVFSQEELAVVFDDVNQFYAEVDKTDMQSQILFNKGYLFLNDLEQIYLKKHTIPAQAGIPTIQGEIPVFTGMINIP